MLTHLTAYGATFENIVTHGEIVQRQIHLNISSPRVKVRETEVVMAM